MIRVCNAARCLVAAVLACAVMCSCVPVECAWATPADAGEPAAPTEQATSSKPAQSTVAYIASLTAKLETAYEDLQQISAQREQAESDLAQTKERVQQAQEAYDKASANLDTTLVEIYKNGAVDYASVLLGSANFSDFASRLYLLENIASDRQGAIAQVKRTREELEKQQDEQQDEVDKIARLERQAQQRAGTITSTLNTQLEFLGKLDPDSACCAQRLRDLQGYARLARQIRRLEEHGWLAPRDASPSRADTWAFPTCGAGSPPRALTALASRCTATSRSASTSTHFARSQYDEGVHIAYEALMPGDLVFFGPSVEGIHHVGIYVGDGKYIQAPRTGDVVKVSSLSNRSDYVGACRPQR